MKKENGKKDITDSNKIFEKILKISLIFGIVIVSGFIVYYVLTPEPGYVTFGILNEDQRAEEYTTEASINETISFYLSVGNYLDREFSFSFHILKGNNNTLVGPFPSNGSLFLSIGNFTLEPNIESIYGEYNISFSEAGSDQRIIIELWEIKDKSEVFYNNLFLWVNIIN